MSASEPYDPSAPLKDATPCPVCGNQARVLEHDDFRFVCGVCGAPRVKARAGKVVFGGAEVAPLRKAQAERGKALWWRMALAVGALTGAGALALTALLSLLFGAGLTLTAVGLSVALPFVLLAAAAFRKGKQRTQGVRDNLDEAWKSATRDAVRSAGGPVTAAQLTELLHVDEPTAERLLTELAVDDDLTSNITDEGALSYAPNDARLRIDAGADAAAQTVVSEDAALEARFKAIEETLAAEEAAQGELPAQRAKR